MAYDFNGSNQYLSTASSPVSAYPMTLAAWAKVDTANTDQVILAVNENGSPNHRLAILRSSGNDARAQSFGSTNAVSIAGAVSTGTWLHFCGVFPSSSSRTAYLNAVAGSAETTTSTINALNEINVAMRRSTAGVGLYFNGNIAECGVWNVALTAAEIASLADGMTCDKVRPQSLVAYFPLVRNLVELKGGLTITNNNTATVADHPRVYA